MISSYSIGEIPWVIYVTDSHSWYANTINDGSDNIQSYGVGFPLECLPVVRDKHTIHADLIHKNVCFRKVRIRRTDAPL